MNCNFRFTGRLDGERFIHVCEACGREVRSKSKEPSVKAQCRATAVPSRNVGLVPPPLPRAEIERRLSICVTCEHWKPESQGCKVCGTCGSGQSMYSGLLRDPTKRCPHPDGSKWGPPLQSPLKVAFLAPSLLLGGAERWIASLCRHFDPARVWPQAIVLTEPKSRSPIVEAWLPKHVQVVPAESLPSVGKQVDVLISWGAKDLAQRTAGLPCRLVDVQHGTMGFGQHQADLAQAAIDAGAELAAVGEACLENFPPEYRDRVTVIQNGAETDRLQPIAGREATRAKLGIQPGEKVCLFVGRISKVKNLDGLAAAMKLLRGWRLVVAGPEYQKHHSLGEAIVLPSQEQLGDLFAAADVFCAPSHHEANSLAVIEAWLAGVPTVTTAYPAALAMQEKHGSLSWLVPLNPSPEVLAQAIQVAAPRGDKVKHAQRIALEHYTAAAMASRWSHFLESLRSRPAELASELSRR